MSNCYFISDLHFGHESVAKIRGFPDVYCHDENLIAQWNLTIGKRDTVYILGDISMHDINQYKKLGQLLGNKILVAGNHDKGKGWIREVSKYVSEIHGVKHYSSAIYGRMFLTHIPIHPLEFEYHKQIKFNIHGHIHKGYEINDSRYINVCAEIIDYKPKTLDELIGSKLKLVA